MASTDVTDVRPRPAAPCLSVILVGVSLALLALSLAAGLVDTRTLEGVPVWSKPTKFAASFALLFATIAWLETRLSDDWRSWWLLKGTIAAMAVSFFAEMGYIILQVSLGEPSHFNLSTPFNEFMYMIVMAYGAIVLVIGVGVYGYAAWADEKAALTPALRLGTALGFGTSFLLTLFIAGYIGGNGTSFVGTPGPDHNLLPFFGWSAEIGDLRPAHFFALHAMQVLPVLGAVLDRLAPPKKRLWVLLGTVVYSLATVGLFVQALAGQPMIAL